MELISAGERRVTTQLKELYVRAFPACERKPYEVIEEKQRAGELDVFAIEQDGSFCGLAISVKYKDIVLLDYFAIEDSVRNKGYGSMALMKLCEYYQDKRFILEVESTLENAPNHEQRVARKEFYLRNGWSELGVVVFIYETQMELLGYGTDISFGEYEELYRQSYPERLPKGIE